MEKRKVIFDIIHGYIEISSDIESIINDEAFQRLKFINQLTAQHLYPSANHTRFEHSLGVMQLATDFFEKLRPQIRDVLRTKLEVSDVEVIRRRNTFLKRHLIYAALLHDVGHAPLSHVGETLFNLKEIKTEINKLIKRKKLNINIDSLVKGSPHEWMSCYVILDKFYNMLTKEISRNLNYEMEIDFEFIMRIITGNLYDKADFWDRDIVISIVNSETVDVDRLDYLMRDNFMTGLVGPQIDKDRLIESLILTSRNKISFKHSGLSAIQKVIDCRDNIYLWVCNHHTVVYTDYLYKEALNHLSNLKEQGLTKYSEYIDRNDLFSCDAISRKCVTDNDALFYIRKAMNNSKGKKASNYTNKLTDQLLNRSFLKPTWKTLYEYTKFMKENFEAGEREEIVEFINSSKENRALIVRKLLDLTGLKRGDLFLVERSNKFFSASPAKFCINIDGKETELSDLLPPRNYSEIYDKVTFYLFCKQAKIKNVKEQFVKIMKDYKHTLAL